MAQQKFPQVGNYTNDTEDFLRRVASNLQIVMKGKQNNTGEITLAASATTTTVSLSKGDLTPTSVIHFMPTTANAGVEAGSGNMYVSSINAQAVSSSGMPAYSFKIAHTNTSTSDRIFKFSFDG